MPRPKLTVARFPILDPCDQHWAWHLRSPLFIDGAQSVHFVSHTYYKHYLFIYLYVNFRKDIDYEDYEEPHILSTGDITFK